MAPSGSKSGGGGRGSARNRGGQNRGNIQAATNPSSTKFEGNEPELKGYIFDYGDHRHVDAFITTKKRMEEYVGANYSHGADIRSSLENGTLLTIPMPTEPTNYDDNNNVLPLTELQRLVLNSQVVGYTKRVAKLNENVKKAYSLVLGQCTENLRAKLKQKTDWATVSTDYNALALVELIKSIVFKYEDRKFQPLSMHRTKKSFYHFRQGNLSNSEYLEQFKNRLEVMRSHGTRLCEQAVAVQLAKEDPDDGHKEFFHSDDEDCLDDAERAHYWNLAEQLEHAIAFLDGADPRRYKDLMTDLENDFTKGAKTHYPTTLVKAYEYLNEYKVKSPQATNTVDTSEQTVAFTQKGSSAKKGSAKKYEPWMKGKICHNCGEEDHISPVCPHPKKEDKDESDEEEEAGKKKSAKGKKKKSPSNESGDKDKQVSFAQKDKQDSDGDDDRSDSDGSIFCNIDTEDGCELDLRKLILLDNQSTTDLFCNKRFVTNIHEVNKTMTIKGNGGTLKTNLMGHLKGYGDVWFSDQAITNILSMANVSKKYRVTYDSADGCAGFVVHKEDRKVHFKMHSDGLHYYDPRKKPDNLSFIQTVEENEVGYSKRDLKLAKTARSLYAKVGHPSLDDGLQGNGQV